MASAITEAATYETSVIGPDGTDLISAAGVRNGLQDLANRTKFLKESFVDIKHANNTQSDLDLTSGTFSDLTYAISSLTFTNVSVGDVILLDCSTTWDAAAFTADGTDPYLEMRWLVGGATDATISGASTYPVLRWGSTVVNLDTRAMSFRSVYVAAGATGSLAAKLQGRCSASHPLVMAHAQIIGTHFRLGVA